MRIHSGRKNQSLIGEISGLLLPIPQLSKSEQQTYMMLLPLNKEMKNWFSPTPISLFLLTFNFTNHLESNYHSANL